MELLKKNLLSIICGLVAILAVAAIFWPINGKYDDLRTELKDSIDVGTRAEGIAVATRFMPILSPFQDSAAPLPVFPNQQVIDAARIATDKLSQESKNMTAAANKANIHALLVAGSLPSPDQNKIYEWTHRYVGEIAGDARWRTMLHAGSKVTEDEIKAGEIKLHDGIFQAIAAPSQEMQQDMERQYAAQSLQLKPKLAMDRARSISVYLEPHTLDQMLDLTLGEGGGKTLLQANDPSAIGKLWDAQMRMWVTDDVAAAIARANLAYADADVPNAPPVLDVLHAPVKQWISITEPLFTMPTSAADLKSVGGAVPSSLIVSPTGHVSNGMYDVWHYDVVLDVDAAKVNQVIREFEVGQFITVLNVQMTSVDSALQASGGFMYGDKPVARLQLHCEELFLHSWLDLVTPDTRKNGIGVKTTGTGTAIMPGGQTDFSQSTEGGGRDTRTRRVRNQDR